MNRLAAADVVELGEASVELFRSAMFYYWLRGGEELEDQSELITWDRMRNALDRCGFDVEPYEEFRAALEAKLVHRS